MKLKRSALWLVVVWMAGTIGPLRAEAPSRSTVRKRRVVYKRIGDVKLVMNLYEPTTVKPEDRRSAIVFFFGGGWRAGSPAQFEFHCRHLAELGMVAAAPDYRVLSRHKTLAVKCVEDAKSAVRWMREHAEELGIDPDRIAAGGGSAGGHIAACTALVPGFEAEGEDQSISSVPNALVLFNPALVMAPIDGRSPFPENRMKSLARRLGTEPRKISPYHHVRKNLPPSIIFHGTADKVVPFRTAEAFAKAMQAQGNRCELHAYKGKGHGFFNYRKDRETYEQTVKEMDAFLKSVGLLPAVKS